MPTARSWKRSAKEWRDIALDAADAWYANNHRWNDKLVAAQQRIASLEAALARAEDVVTAARDCDAAFADTVYSRPTMLAAEGRHLEAHNELVRMLKSYDATRAGADAGDG